MNQNNSIKIICEIASTHCGNKEELYSLIDAGVETGCDYLKFQIFSYDALVHTEKVFPELQKIEIAYDVWEEAIDYASKKVRVIIEAFDRVSLYRFVNDARVTGIKVPTADLSDKDALTQIILSGKKVFAGVGGASVLEIDDFMSNFNASEINPVLLYGFQSFPTKIEDSCLQKISEIIERYECEVGYADHIDGSSKLMAFSLPAMAVAHGSSYIEKHITLDRSKKKYDYYSSLEPHEFCEFVDYIRKISSASDYRFDLNEPNNAEQEYRFKMKKFAVTVGNVSKATHLSEIKLRYCRTSEPGLTGFDIRTMCDEKAKTQVAILNNTILQKGQFF